MDSKTDEAKIEEAKLEVKKADEGGISAVGIILNGIPSAIPRWLLWTIAGIAIAIPLYHFFTAWFTQATLILQRHFALALVMTLCFLVYPSGRKSWNSKLNWKFAIDLVFILATVVPMIFLAMDIERYTLGVGSLTTWELICGTATLIALFEAVRRTVGWSLVIVLLAVLAHCMYGNHFPGLLKSPGIPWHTVISQFYFTTYGIYGLPIGVVTSFLIMFFIFISWLEASGATRVFIDLANSAVGRFSGGPAKVAVVGSSLLGTASGSPMANVVGTGSFTIPLMKRMGFPPHLAGAVEAASSTGGQFVPPVMGITAFLIASFTGVSYFRVCLAGITPAFLYYFAIFLAVHFEAKKMGMGGLKDTPKFFPTMLRSWLVIVPLLILIVFMTLGYNLSRVAFLATVSVIACAIIDAIFRRRRLDSTPYLLAFEGAGRTAILVAVACAAAGLISGIFYASGLGDKIAYIITQVSAGRLWILLLLSGLLAIILGMGMPTPAIYVIMYVSLVPVMQKMGVSMLGANFFVFYVGVTSGITPPVCLTSFVAASIAGAGMMRTGFTAMRLSYVAWVAPVLFVVYPELLGEGTPQAIAVRVLSILIGTAGLTAALSGWFIRKINWLERVLLIAGGFMGYLSPLTINIIGAVVVLTLLLLQRITKKGLIQRSIGTG